MMKSMFRVMTGAVVAACVANAWGAADTGPAPKPPARTNKIRVLIVTGGHDFQRKEFFATFNAYPDVAWQEVKHPDAEKWFAPDKASGYDVMVWYDMNSKISEQGRKNLEALLKKGKPLVAMHHCAADLWQHGGTSLPRGAEFVHSSGPQERRLLWRILSKSVADEEKCHLGSTVHRRLDGAEQGVQREDTPRPRLTGAARPGPLAGSRPRSLRGPAPGRSRPANPASPALLPD